MDRGPQTQSGHIQGDPFTLLFQLGGSEPQEAVLDWQERQN